MRGKPHGGYIRVRYDGITPADAGKTAGVSVAAVMAAGSPPRMRGKPSLQPLAGITFRITPADAGKTCP